MKPLAVLLASLFIAAVAAAPRTDADPPLEMLLARAGAYVRGLEVQMAMVVGDEVYHQRAFARGRSSQDRTIQAEMLFWWLDEDHVWLSVRNVRKVNKTVVADSKDRLERALHTPELPAGPEVVVNRSARLRGLQAESARYDIGTVQRTTSNPTEVLQYLLPENQEQFLFNRAGEHRANGTRAWKLTFVEQRRPTVLRFGDLDVPTSGAVWIRADDGVVVRTERTVSLPRFSATVTVDFQRDAKLTLWVPKKMEERYGGLVQCSSDYSNYRQFETSGRIVPEGPK
jgi:hypothetical protein